MVLTVGTPSSDHFRYCCHKHGKINEHYMQNSSVGFSQPSLRCSDCYHAHCLEFSLEIQYIQFAAATFFEMWKYVEMQARNVFSPRASIGIHIFEALK